MIDYINFNRHSTIGVFIQMQNLQQVVGETLLGHNKELQLNLTQTVQEIIILLAKLFGVSDFSPE